MIPVTIDDYVFLLSQYMLSADYKARDYNIKRKQTPNGNSMQVANGINPKRMSDKHYFQILEFYEFITKYKDLSDGQLKAIISCKHEQAKGFKYIQKLYDKYPNFIDDLKDLGPENFALKIVKGCKNHRVNDKEQLWD